MNCLNLLLLCSLIINLIIIFFILLNERREPEKTLIWILILIISGPIGFTLYIFLGKDIRRDQIKKRNFYDINPIKSNKGIENAFSHKTSTEIIQISNLISKLNSSPIITDSEIKIFQNGFEKFESLKDEIKKAVHHIHLEYFIVRNDCIGKEIKNLLIQKSREGVKVKFIMDKLGCRKLPKSYINELKENKIEILFYSYISTPFLKLINTQINYRNHRKIVIIDGITSFIGGINIGDEYLGKSKLGYWRDTHIMIKGECSLAIQNVFINDYLNIKKLSGENVFLKDELINYFPKIIKKSNTLTQIIKGGPNFSKDSMIIPIIKLITSAKKTIKICTPYFIPSTGLINILKSCLLSGIEISIIFPGKPDHKLVYYASRTYLQELYNVGCKIYFYDKNSFLHSKFIIIDDQIVTIGSTNIDIRSFEINHELNIVIYDEKICKNFIHIFNEDIKNSMLSDDKFFKNIPKLQILYENIARLFSSIL